jgi:hypothetical protein
MNSTPDTDALYYPFHLCHEQTLSRLLALFQRIHFRDYMALRLSRFSGTTAYSDRMGGFFPDLVANGRLVQGYDVSGPLSQTTAAAIDRDLKDTDWRALFHQSLVNDRRFQRGLFELSHVMHIGGSPVPGPAAWLNLIDDARREHPYAVAALSRLSTQRLAGDAAYDYEYGLALLTTSAALTYTVQLSAAHALAVVTDSPAHHALLTRTAGREGFALANRLIDRTGY